MTSLKRPRESEASAEGEDAPAPKVARLQVYVVTRMDYDDDYKHRDDPADVDVDVFHTREEADAHVREKEDDYIRDYLSDRDYDERYAKYFKDGELDKAALVRDRDELLASATEGEYIPRKVSWEVHPRIVRAAYTPVTATAEQNVQE